MMGVTKNAANMIANVVCRKDKSKKRAVKRKILYAINCFEVAVLYSFVGIFSMLTIMCLFSIPVEGQETYVANLLGVILCFPTAISVLLLIKAKESLDKMENNRKAEEKIEKMTDKKPVTKNFFYKVGV